MSDEGRIARGKKWYMLGKLNEERGNAVAEDPNKLADIEFYKQSMKVKPENPEENKKGKK
jgi:hypothetical protein